MNKTKNTRLIPIMLIGILLTLPVLIILASMGTEKVFADEDDEVIYSNLVDM